LRFSVARISGKKSPISIHGSNQWPKLQKDVLKILLSFLACSQIWLNLLMDDCHFGYITKLSKTNIHV
jgi:hypothetical protein